MCLHGVNCQNRGEEKNESVYYISANSIIGLCLWENGMHDRHNVFMHSTYYGWIHGKSRVNRGEEKSMGRLIDADALKAKCGEWYTEEGLAEGFIGTIGQLLDEQPTIEERKTDGFTTWEKSVADSYRVKDIIQKFHDYQVEWLKSHYDIELEPLLEEMIVRFLHDTANCYMMEAQP